MRVVTCAMLLYSILLFQNATAQPVDLTNAGVIVATKMPVVSRYADVLVNGLSVALLCFTF